MPQEPAPHQTVIRKSKITMTPRRKKVTTPDRTPCHCRRHRGKTITTAPVLWKNVKRSTDTQMYYQVQTPKSPYPYDRPRGKNSAAQTTFNIITWIHGTQNRIKLGAQKQKYKQSNNPSRTNERGHFSETGKSQEYRHMMKEPDTPKYTRPTENNIWCLFQGIRDIEGTDTCFFIH